MHQNVCIAEIERVRRVFFPLPTFPRSAASPAPRTSPARCGRYAKARSWTEGIGPSAAGRRRNVPDPHRLASLPQHLEREPRLSTSKPLPHGVSPWQAAANPDDRPLSGRRHPRPAFHPRGVEGHAIFSGGRHRVGCSRHCGAASPCLAGDRVRETGLKQPALGKCTEAPRRRIHSLRERRRSEAYSGRVLGKSGDRTRRHRSSRPQASEIAWRPVRGFEPALPP